MAGTREDAHLMVEFAKWGSMIGLNEANRKIFGDDFDPDSADALDADVHAVLVFNETIGTLVNNDLIDRDLVYDWLWVSGAWERVGPAAVRAREKAGVAELWVNFETLARGQA